VGLGMFWVGLGFFWWGKVQISFCAI